MVHPTLPAGYVDLATAFQTTDGSLGNIIGVVVDVLEPVVNAKSGQHQFTFKLQDAKLRDSWFGAHGYTVRFFKTDINQLPQVKRKGDVVLLRNAKFMLFSAQPLALSNFHTTSLVFPASSIPDPSYQIAYYGAKATLTALGAASTMHPISAAVQQYVIQLKAALKDLPELQANDERLKRKAPPTAPALDRRKLAKSTLSNKFQLVQDLQHRRFADVVVQVVKKFPTQFSTSELYVTDYTENKDMFLYEPPEDVTLKGRDGDDYGYAGQPSKKAFPGPYGQLVLKVTAKQPHAGFINSSVDEGDILLLQNIKMKIRDYNNKLEGDMWPDDWNPEKVQVQKMRNKDIPEVKALLARKDKYWASRASKQPVATASRGGGGPKKKTKGPKKLARKEKHLQREQAKADAALATNSKSNSNQHVRCSYEETPLSSIHTIIDPHNFRHGNKTPHGETYDLPFMNAKYRTTVKVLDFDPPDLENFAVPADDEGPSSTFSPDMDWGLTPKWEWSFSLLLSDGQDRIWVNVHHEEAQYLLNEVDDATDLRQDPKLLAKLREKLYVLWGDLEEQRKDGRIQLEPSNLPFECCLAEYGVLDDGGDQGQLEAWSRQYSLFGTTIR